MEANIFKTLNGRTLLVIVDNENKAESFSKTESGIIYDKGSDSSVVQYKLATITEVGDEMPEKYTVGGRIMLVPDTRARPIEINGKYGEWIPEGVVIGILNEIK